MEEGESACGAPRWCHSDVSSRIGDKCGPNEGAEPRSRPLTLIPAPNLTPTLAPALTPTATAGETILPHRMLSFFDFMEAVVRLAVLLYTSITEADGVVFSHTEAPGEG